MIDRGSLAVVETQWQLPAPPTFIRHFQQHGYVIAKSVLPERTCSVWRAQAVRLWREYGRTINKPGRPGGTELRYEVVTGEDVDKKWPEMFSFYCAPDLHAWIKAITGADDISRSKHLQSAININVLSKPGEVYPWHFDAVPYTLILYLSDSSPKQGGALEIRAKRSHGMERPVTYLPRSGDLLLMDGTRCYHRITPLRQAHVRISIPMVFPKSIEHSRSLDLDSFLYDRAA